MERAQSLERARAGKAAMVGRWRMERRSDSFRAIDQLRRRRVESAEMGRTLWAIVGSKQVVNKYSIWVVNK
jgi:hypothetical protein